MPHDHEIDIEHHERLALEDEYQRLAKNLYERGVITPDAYNRAIAGPDASERQKEDAV